MDLVLTIFTWNVPIRGIVDANEYLFSLINKDNNPLKIKCLIYEDAAFGPSDIAIQVYGSFQVGGGGNDLIISADSNVNTGSHSNLGNIYKHPVYALGSTLAREFLAGSYRFKTLEIEMFCEQTLN